MKLLNTMDFPTWEIKLIVFPKSPSGPSPLPRPAQLHCVRQCGWPSHPSAQGLSASDCDLVRSPMCSHQRWLTPLSPGLLLQDTWPLCRRGYYISFWQLKLFKGQQCHFFVAEIKVKNMTSWEQCAFVYGQPDIFSQRWQLAAWSKF